TGCAPRIGSCQCAVLQRPEEVDHRDQIANTQNGGTGSGHHVKHLELWWISMITARHSEVTQNELRKERQIKPEENHQGRKPRPAFRVHASSDLRPPKVHSTEIGHYRSTH